MAGGLLRVVVVTPEERLVDTMASEVVARSSDGDLTVLDGHARLVTDVLPGEVRVVSEDEGTLRLAVHGGYLQVEHSTGAEDLGDEVAESPVSPGGLAALEWGTRVTLLAGVAELSGQIDATRAELAKTQAMARVEAARGLLPSGDDEPGGDVAVELADAEPALRRAEVRLEVASGGGGRAGEG